MDSTNEYLNGDFAVAGFLYNQVTKSVLLHLREPDAKYNPSKWAFFVGLNDEEESPIEAFTRTLYEEIGLDVHQVEVEPLYHYMNEDFEVIRYVFFVKSDADLDSLNLSEEDGYRWVSLFELDKYELTINSRTDLTYFKRTLNIG